MTRLNIPLFVALAVSILSTVPANAGGNTLPHQRMIRKHGPAVVGRVQAFDHGLHVRQADPTTAATSAAASATSAPASATRSSASSAAASATSAAATSSATSETTSVASSTSSGGLLNSLTSLLASTSSVVSTSSIPTTSSTSSVETTSSSSSVAPQTTTEAAATSSPQPTLNIASPSPTSTSAQTTVKVVTSIAPAAQASESAAAASKASKITRNTIISLVVIASCIGGAIAIWTVIRKWKLAPSEKFDDRMQPIDWAPPPAAGAHEETMEEKRHRRAGSSGSHGSFTSGGVGQSENGHAKGTYNDSQHGHGYGLQSQDFPPAHDFTAGTAQPGYGQYYGGQQYAGGAAGYADLQRGPSMSESTYSHGAGVTRGLSYNRGPAAGYEAQPGAGGVPPLPNPYGGEYAYGDYGHGQQPVQQQPQGQGQHRGF